MDAILTGCSHYAIAGECIHCRIVIEEDYE